MKSITLGGTALIAVALALLLPYPGFAQSTNPAPNVWAWGDNSSGQCNVPQSVTNAVAIAAGSGFSMALKADGTVVTWGTPQDFGFQVTNAIAVAAGGDAAWVLLADGSYHVSYRAVSTWNYPFNSQIPQGLLITNFGTMRIVFPTTPTITNVTSLIGAGNSDVGSFAVFSLADGTTALAGFSPVSQGNLPLPLVNGVRAFATGSVAGKAVSYAWLLSDGTVGGKNVANNPTMVVDGVEEIAKELTNVKSVTANSSYPLALKADGSLESWGGNVARGFAGILHTNLYTNYYSGFTNIVAITGNQSADNYLAIRSDGVVIDIPSGSVANPSLPFATAISAGSSHALALVQPDVPVTPPTILRQPQSQTIAVHRTLYLRCTAVGYGPIAYQWFYNQTNALPAATNNMLVITNIQPQASGAYSMVASNFSGWVTSSPAFVSVIPVLDVYLAPAISMLGGTGITYRLEYSNPVGSTNTWIPVTTITLTNSPQLYVDLTALGQPARFYRLVQLP